MLLRNLNVSSTNTKEVSQKKENQDTNFNNEEQTSQEDVHKKKKVAIHVYYGRRLIDELNLEYFNGNIYFYNSTGVHSVVSDKEITSAIIKHINPELEPSICKKIIFFVKNILYNDDIKKLNTDVVNFKNCLFDLKTQTVIEHTPRIFTVNQLAIDYNPSLPFNGKVETYLDEVSNHRPLTRKALLQILGYLLTTKNNIQKIIIIYGPTASNGKSVLLKVFERTIGSNNVCHKSMEEFDKDFGADGMEFKQLNISSELPQTRIKNISVLKKTKQL